MEKQTTKIPDPADSAGVQAALQKLRELQQQHDALAAEIADARRVNFSPLDDAAWRLLAGEAEPVLYDVRAAETRLAVQRRAIELQRKALGTEMAAAGRIAREVVLPKHKEAGRAMRAALVAFREAAKTEVAIRDELARRQIEFAAPLCPLALPRLSDDGFAAIQRWIAESDEYLAGS